jgi:hypothetical protein
MAHPEGPSQTTIPLSFLRYDGGINTRYSTLSLEENEVYDMENFHIEARGGLEKRKGYRFWYTGDSKTTYVINGLYYFKPTAAVVRSQNGALHSNVGAGWVPLTGTLTISTNLNDLISFTTFKKTLFGTNGINIPFKWTGAGDAVIITQAIGATGNNITKAKVCVRHRERIILGDVTTSEAGGTRYESRLWPSAVGSLDTWHSDFTDGKIIDIDEGDGDSITALVDVMGYLVVFKQNSLHRINDFGLSGVQQRIKVANVGTPGPFSVSVVGNVVFFLDAVGQLWAYDAKGTNEDAVINISERKLGKDTLDLINKTRLAQAHLWHDPVRNELRCFLTEFGATTTKLLWTLSLTSGGFGKLRYQDSMNISARYEDSNGNIRCLVGSNDGGVFLLDETEQDNGTSYNAHVVTRWLDFGDNSLIKGTRNMHIYGTVIDSQSLAIEHRTMLQGAGTNYSVTLDGPGARLDAFTLDLSTLGGTGESLAKLYIPSYSRWHQFKISQSTNKGLRLIGFVLMVVIAGREQDSA